MQSNKVIVYEWNLPKKCLKQNILNIVQKKEEQKTNRQKKTNQIHQRKTN